MDAARSRRQYRASITSISRTIATRESPFGGTHWLAVGDSLTLRVVETHCHHDACTPLGSVADSGWSLSDSTIATLRAPCSGPKGPGWVGAGPCVVVYGLTIGRTTVKVRGLHGSADTMPSRTVPQRNLAASLVVGRPVHRIRLSVPTTVRVGDPVIFRVQALDRAGRVVPDVPIQVQVDMGTYQTLQSFPSAPIRFPVPGQRRVIARFRGLADTSVVTVVAR
jgi:hypothetical protein